MEDIEPFVKLCRIMRNLNIEFEIKNDFDAITGENIWELFDI